MPIPSAPPIAALVMGRMVKPLPKISNVKALSQQRLLVTFANNVGKIYDCSPLFKEDNIQPLSNESLFKAVTADESGYGISWTDELHLSQSELWLKGVLAEPSN